MALRDPKLQKLGTFLNEGVYVIPDYQREYSWDSENQVCDFWDDLINIHEERKHDKKSTHFFGQIVVHEDKDKEIFNLIDGQQRITTSIIALAVIRDFYKNIKSEIGDAEDEYNEIINQYIGRYKETTGENRLKFQSGLSDRSFFRINIQSNSPQESIAGLSPSQKRIVKSYNYLHSKLEEYLEKFGRINEKYLALNSLYKSLKDGFVLLTLTTDEINEAFVVFETLNARGKELETSDLLKNYFFMKANGSVKNIDQIKDKWNEMISILYKKEDVTKLIRYYWNSTRKYVHDKQLYKEISKNVNEYTDCFNIVKDLEKVADLYNTLSNPEKNHYFEDKRIEDTLKHLQALRVTTFYPLIISLVLRKESEANILSVLKALDVMSFREFAVAGKNPNRIERFLADLALAITMQEKNVEDAINEIRDHTTDDKELKVYIAQLKPSINLAKFILREIENYIADSPEKKLDDSNSVIHLEHIMPQNNSEWNYPAEEHDNLVNLLGNMTLLSEKLNKEASNNKFEEKKKKYALSAIKLTKILCEYDCWNDKTISNRTEFLAEQIIKIWPK